ncbi:MAG: MarR family transcriptional regulator [Betaproteobacteria bacterium]
MRTAEPARQAKVVSPNRAGDLESRANEAHHDSLRLWLRLLTCTQLIEANVRSRLRRDFAITLPRFDLMAQLERNPQGLKMGELSRRMMVTSGNVTGITDQLVDEGLVRRTDTPGDRRGYMIKLTPAGKRAFDRMAAAHEEWVIELLGGLSMTERGQLNRLLGRVKLHVNGVRPEQ